MKSIADDVESYEKWLRKQCRVVEDDLDEKHRKMRGSEFAFLRATCFRWAAQIDAICPELANAPQALCVGDAHIENFGTWRDAEARLVWGVNDFDEATSAPYAYDLVRLATSARLAPKLRMPEDDAADAILKGYKNGLEEPRPALLDEHAQKLRPLLRGDADAASDFWSDVESADRADPPDDLRKALTLGMPDGAEGLEFCRVVKGLGSLGRPRYLAVAHWRGGRVVIEAKARVPSAWQWAHPGARVDGHLLELAYGAYRSPDPTLRIDADFVLRRSAPDAQKIELEDVTDDGLRGDLLRAMGADLAAIHLASVDRPTIKQDLDARGGAWLRRASADAERAVREDFSDFTRG